MSTSVPNQYEKLTAIDTKCGAILQLTSLLLVFISLAAVQDTILKHHLGLYRVLVATLLLSCLAQIWVLWFHERPSRRLVRTRIWVFNIGVLLTALACLAVSGLVIYALVWEFSAASS